MFSFSMPELGIILVIVLMVFGPGKLPEVTKSLGKGISEFRRSVSGEATENAVIRIEKQAGESK